MSRFQTIQNNLAVVIGVGGGLGAALLAQLRQSGAYGKVLALGRSAEVQLDYLDDGSIARGAQQVARACAESACELRMLVVATGFLHGEQGQPERSWSHLDVAYLQHVFAINTLARRW